MDLEPREVFELLANYSNDNIHGPQESHHLLSQLNNTFSEEEFSLALLDLYLQYMFNGNNGIHIFVQKVVVKKCFKQAVVDALGIIFVLLNNFPLKIEKKILEINDTCIVVLKSPQASSDEKVKCLDLLILSFEKVDKCVENNEHYGNIYRTMYNTLSLKKCDSIEEKVFVALAVFVKKFEYVVTGQQVELKLVILKHLEKEMVKGEKSQKLLCGLFTALRHFCATFPMTNVDDKNVIDVLYKYIKEMAITKSRMKMANRAALMFLNDNISLFRDRVFTEYKPWYKILNTWVTEKGAEEKKVGATLLLTFYGLVGSMLHTEAKPEYRTILVYLIIHTKNTLKNTDSSSFEKRLSIHGIRLLTKACLKQLSEKDVTNLFSSILQNFEQKFVLNQDPTTEDWDYLPDYIQTVSSIIVFRKNVSNDIICLHRGIIAMIKTYPQIPHLHRGFVTDAFVISIACLRHDQDLFETFISDVVYQSVIWSCSHQHVSESEMLEIGNDKIVTVKSYLPFWISLIRLELAVKYEKNDISLSDRTYLLVRVLHKLIQALFILVNKLNVSVSLKDPNLTDVNMAFKVDVIDDFAIFLNVVDFYTELLPQISPQMLQPCIHKLINCLIQKCIIFPLISGFYKLLATCLNISNKLNYFEESQLESTADIIVCYESLLQFLNLHLTRMKQFKDELLIACLQVLLHTPVTAVKEIIESCVPAFLTVFSVGRSYLKLANVGIITLEHWQENLPPDEFEPFLLQILPQLDTFLRSKSLGGTSFNMNEKVRKTAKVMNKRKVAVEIEGELVQLQRQMLKFMGHQNTNLCKAFVMAGNNSEPSIWSDTSHLKVTLPYDDINLDIYFDRFVPRLVDLALHCSDRKTRITACELLQGVIMIFLGTTKQMNQSGLKELNSLLMKLASPVLQLGCDVDQVVKQLFEPLFLQLIHWYTNPLQHKGRHTAIIIDTLMEGITNSTDSSVRDFSGRCINEFLKWTIKQTNESNLARDPAIIKVLLKKMRFFSTHPDYYKKLGAALIFNNIYKDLREEKSLLSMFWVEFLHIFVISLSCVESSIQEDEYMLQQINNTLNHLQRGFVEKRVLFNQIDKDRRIPSDIAGGLLKDIVLWVLEYTGSNSVHCRTKCMELFINMAPCVQGFENVTLFMSKNISNQSSWFSNIYEKYLTRFYRLSLLTDFEQTSALFKWLEEVECGLDGLEFTIKYKLDDLEDLPTSATLKSIDYYMQKVAYSSLSEALQLIHEQSCIYTVLEVNKYKNNKSAITMKILKLCTTLIKNGQSRKVDNLWNHDLWNLITNAIFNPQSLGIDTIIEKNKHLDVLDVLLNTIPGKLQELKMTELVEYLRKYTEQKYVNNINLNGNVSRRNRNYIKGLIFLQTSTINKFLKLETYYDGLIHKLLGNFINSPEDVVLVNQLQDTTIEYCSLILQFSLQNDADFKDFVRYLYNPCMVQSMNLAKEIPFGLFLITTFEDSIINPLIIKFECFLDIMLNELGLTPTSMTYILKILSYLDKNKKSLKHLYRSILQRLISRWGEFEDFFKQSVANIEVSFEIIKLINRLSFHEKNCDIHNINKWLINILTYQINFPSKENELDFRMQVFHSLIDTFNETEGYSDSLRYGLSNLKSMILEPNVQNIIMKFNRVLDTLPKVKSPIVFEFIIGIYVSLSQTPELLSIQDNLERYALNSTKGRQYESMDILYKYSISDNLDGLQKYYVGKNLIPRIFQSCKLEIFETFYTHNIKQIIGIMELPATIDNLYMKTVQFILIEILFARMHIDKSSNINTTLVKAALSSDKTNMDLLKLFLKFTLTTSKEVIPISVENTDIIRLYKCHSYNALVSIATNCLADPKFYTKLFFRLENNEDILWKGLVDVNKTYHFQIDFDAYPKQRKILINIRDELKQQRRVAQASCSVHYIGSQRLFNSSLSDDITKYDLNNANIRSKPTDEEASGTDDGEPLHEIILEDEDINNHECMATVCGLINFITNFGDDEDMDELPAWMGGMKDILMNDRTPSNVKIFLVKVIANTSHVFEKYAKWFLAPIMKFITDKCAGKMINFFISDIIALLASWSRKVIPENEDELLTSSLLLFLFENINSERRDMFKHNLELIKLIVEAWKANLQIPYPFLYSKLIGANSDKDREVGIHLTAILLGNKIYPCETVRIAEFFESLVGVLKCTQKSIYTCCAETIGLFLRKLKSDDIDDNYIGIIQSAIDKKYDDDKYGCILEAIVLHYPDIAKESHICQLLSRLSTVTANVKAMYLRIILRKVDTLELLSDFKLESWDFYIDSENIEVQKLSLDIVYKSLAILEHAPRFKIIIEALCKKTNSQNVMCRKCVYDIFITICNEHEKDNDRFSNVITMCKECLLIGLRDKDLEIRSRMYEFWAEHEGLPKSLFDRFVYLLSALYTPSNEQSFLGYSAYILLSPLKMKEDYDKELFPHPLEDCDFEDYILQTNWRIQHPASVPMFAETLHSFSGDPNLIDEIHFGHLRETQANLTFAPTQSFQNEEIPELSNSQSSLYVGLDGDEGADSLFKDPNSLTISQSYKGLRKRFLKDKTKISQHFANYEVKKSIKRVERRKDFAREKEKKVTIYRNYRKGDLPDVQITLSSILIPLQILALRDADIAKSLYLAFYQNMLEKLDRENDFIEQVNTCLSSIFNSSIQYNTNLFRTFLDLIISSKNKMVFQPSLISKICLSSGLISTGTFILEELLISYNDPPEAKRMNGLELSDENKCWVKLAELYKEMNEWDIVRAIFLEKLNCKEIVKSAIKCESRKQWPLALDYYESLIKEDECSERRDFYYESYFKCLANLGKWSDIPNAIKSITQVECDQSVWDALWNDEWNQQKLLPWYITAEVNEMLFKQSVNSSMLSDINKCLIDSHKSDYMKDNFSEMLSMLWIMNHDVDTAEQYLRNYTESFLENWQILDPMFNNLRFHKILKLRNFADINSLISLYKKLEPCEVEPIFNKLQHFWNNLRSDKLLSIVLQETRVLYYRQFINLISRKISSFNDPDFDHIIEELKNTKFKLDFGLVNGAIEEDNFYMARKYGKEHCEKKEMELAFSKMLYIKSKSIHNDREAVESMLKSLDRLKPVFNQKDHKILLTAHLTMFEILQDISNNLTRNSTPMREVGSRLLKITDQDNIFSSPNDISIYGAKQLKDYIIKSENQYEENMNEQPDLQLHKHVANTYVKLAYYEQNIGNMDSSNFIMFVLKAMKLGSVEAKQLFPCILQNKELGTSYKDVFIEECGRIPTWMFLGWIPQLLANVDSEKIFALYPVITRIAETYPQAIMYSYRLSKENYKFCDDSYVSEVRKLVDRLDNILSNSQIDIFLKALARVSIPVVTLKYYVQKLIQSLLKRPMWETMELTKFVLEELYCGKPDSRDVGSMIGNSFKEIQKFKQDLSNIEYDNREKAMKKLRTLYEKANLAISSVKHEKFSVMLKDYCPWLANFSASKISVDIEIPGQYDGRKLPLIQHHVKVSSICPNVNVMRSLRKPIKITILGNDTKEYPFLIKFGEDIRQDQRIEQIFNLMNDVFDNDVDCSQQALYISTYQVIPLTTSLGIIQWVNNTTSMQLFIGGSFKTKVKPDTFYDGIVKKYTKWTTSASKHPKTVSDAYGAAAVKYNRDKVIPFFRSLVNEIEWDVLRNAFWKISANTESFIALRHNFMKSYATMCAAHWILGIGDRHLGNTLISLQNGKVIGIDFGHAFGTGTQILPIPELIPFRLTPHIVSFMEPLKELGHFRESMIHSIRCLRASRNLLLATMNVFIEEPSMDWLDHASKNEDTSDRSSHEWYPAQKINQARRKFEGVSSVVIVTEDLRAGHKESPYLDAYVKLVEGIPQHDYRARTSIDLMSEEQQVDCLIDHATDYNLLGRMYAGWMPWV